MYDTGRFFTISGEHLESTPRQVEERSAVLAQLHAGIFTAPYEVAKNRHQYSVGNGRLLHDDLHDHRRHDGAKDDHDHHHEIVLRAMRANNGARCSRLWNGDINGHVSASEADLALCSSLAFWTGGDAEEMDRLFRESGLYRRKWDTPH